MKKNSNFKTMSVVVAALIFAVSASSCKKNNIDEWGEIELKVVNAAPNSGAQRFYLANAILVNGGLDFTDASGYISTHSGSRLVAEFSKEGTGATYATSELWFLSDLHYTVYLAGEGQTARIRYFLDDLSVPAGGKARINFIHLSDAVPDNITIKNAGGDNLVFNLIRDAQSSYFDIAPGDLSLQIFDTSLATNIGNFSLTGLTAGKIYTVYITGSSATGISVHKLGHN